MFEMMLMGGGKTTLPSAWRRLPSGAVPASNAGCMFAENGYVHYLTGATVPVTTNSELWRYDIANEQWVKLACPMPSRQLRTCNVVDGVAYFFGGTPESTGLWKYLISTDTWVELASYPYKYYGAMGAVDGTDIYIAGGVNGNTWRVNFYRYNTLTDTSSSVPASLPVGLNSGAMWILTPGEVLITNGNPSTSQSEDTVRRRYTGSTGWATNTMFGNRHNGSYGGYAQLDKTGYLFGGAKGGSTYYNDFSTFDGTKFITIGKNADNPSPRARVSMAIHDNIVYIYGGKDSTGDLNEFWSYNLN